MQKLRYLGVALLAGTVGAVAALLLAPDSGEATRRRISKGFDRQRRQLARRRRAAMDDASEFLEGQLDAGLKAIEAQVKSSKKALEGVADSLVAQFEEGRRSVSRLVS